MHWYTDVLKKYTQFDGRARRQEYWMYTLFNLIIFIVLFILTRVSGIFFILYFLYALAIIVPSLAVGVRRLHDTNRSGWWILIGLVPFIGGIWLLVLTCLAGDAGQNQYGPDPKAVSA